MSERRRPIDNSAMIPTHSVVTRPAELALVRLCIELGASAFGGALSPAERELIEQARLPLASEAEVDGVRAAIVAGDDPLGTALCRIRPPHERRTRGAFYTPPEIVDSMLDWVLAQQPDRLVDPGCGSGRFSVGAVRRRQDLAIIAIDVDPLATLITRANLAVTGAHSATVLNTDYTSFDLPIIRGRTAFVANPPYVRHHGLDAEAKNRAVAMGRRLGYAVSTLAGLHVHFFLATAIHAQPGDVGCFVTSAEWLDVNYGAVVRDLLVNGLGGESLHVVDARTAPFEDAMTTAAIVCFRVGAKANTMSLRLVGSPAELGNLRLGREVQRRVLAREQRWTPLVRADQERTDVNRVPLRTVARVHRGVVTGANDFFILTRQRAQALGIEEWCRPVIASAEEILQSGGVVRNGPERRLLLDVPASVNRAAYPDLDSYLRRGEEALDEGTPIAQRYVPSHRNPWWQLGTPAPPPIVASYMARQAPFFALNPDGLAIINIAHGIYPRQELTATQLAALVAALNEARDSYRGSGRTYHGGLEKFEPREMEALLVPPIGVLL